METLGISGPPTRDYSFFKRIFWPSADSADADILGQQGFWICLILAIGTCVISAFQGHFILGILFGIFYFLCGVGVREHDVPAAIAVATLYLFNIGGAVVLTKSPPGWLALFVALILIANIRGCAIASRWFKSGDPDLIPTRLNETWQDKLVDQMPAKLWPRIKIAFYFLAVIAILLTAAGVVVTVMHPPVPLSDSAQTIVKG